MPIIALAEDTVRLLGSPTVITSAVDLVKELLENSIDAGAVSVEVLVSQNLVDRIDVRDNGDGIHQEDYESLGRPGHTSKITSFEELQTLGGTTLGFRGQALAAANSLGSIIITTRTARDLTAAVLKLSPGVGGVETRQRTSVPVGTTVSVMGLFRRTPVREQVAIKEAPKSIAKTRQLLQAYALARPQLRLSFKIFGEGNKRSWSYSPLPQASIQEAIIQGFGTELMSKCLIRTICRSTDGADDNASTQEKEKLVIEAVLPKPGADHCKTSKGPFFCVDYRPVSTQRGTMKKLLAAFKSHFSKSLGSADGQKSLKDPFIYVNIVCPPGSYDPNIEPSKNDVLFASESALTQLFERLLSDVYQDQQPAGPFVSMGRRQLLCREQTRTPPPTSERSEDVEPTPLAVTGAPHSQIYETQRTLLQSSSSPCRGQPQDEFSSVNTSGGPELRDGVQSGHSHPLQVVLDSSLERMARGDRISPTTTGTKPGLPNVISSVMPPEATDSLPGRRQAPGQIDNRGWTIDMSADPEISSDDEAEGIAAQFRRHLESISCTDDQGVDSREGLNPWSIAKMTATARQPSDGMGSQAHDPRPPGPMHDEPFDEDLPVLRPYGEASSDLDLSRSTRLGISHKGHQHQHPGFSLASSIGSAAGTRPVCDTSQSFPPHAHASNNRTLPDLTSYRENGEGGMESNGVVQTGLALGRAGDSKRSNNRMQLHIDEIPWRPNPPYQRPRRLNADKRSSPGMSRGTVNSSGTGPLDNHRLTEYGIGQTRQRSPRQQKPRQQNLCQLLHSPAPVSSRPHTRTGERTATQRSNSSQVDKEAWSDGDARKYLIRRQHSEAKHRRAGRQPLKSAKTDRLPLEIVPEQHEMQRLVLTLTTETDNFEGTIGKDTTDDIFSVHCRTELRLSHDMNLDNLTDIETKLKSLLSVWSEKVLGEKADIELNIRSRVKDKTTAPTSTAEK